MSVFRRFWNQMTDSAMRRLMIVFTIVLTGYFAFGQVFIDRHQGLIFMQRPTPGILMGEVIWLVFAMFMFLAICSVADKTRTLPGRWKEWLYVVFMGFALISPWFFGYDYEPKFGLHYGYVAKMHTSTIIMLSLAFLAIMFLVGSFRWVFPKKPDAYLARVEASEQGS